MKRYSPLLVVLGILLVPASAGAQTVRGEVVESQTGMPLEGTVVVLLDADGRALLTTISSSEGRFVARLPGPGAYALRVDRIGYESVMSDPFEAGSGEDVFRRLEIAVVPVELDEIAVEGDRRCVVRPGPEAMTTATVWEQARTALSAASATEAERQLRFDAELWEQELDARSLAIRSEQRTVRRNRLRIPFGSLDAEDLAENGFIQSFENGRYFEFYAPSAEVLLSDVFLDTHCFRVEIGENENEGLIGLAFEPVGRRDVPDVTGTLWLDRATAALRYAEMQYVSRDPDMPTEGARARVDFEELPGGRWIPRRWTIRMPQLIAQRIPGAYSSGLRRSVDSYRVEGGEVTRITDLRGRPLITARRYAVSGVVRDSLADRPLTSATVTIEGTAHTATTDDAGRFAFEDLPPGRYIFRARNARLDSLPAAAWPRAEVEIANGDVRDVELAMPSLQSIVEIACPGLWRAVPGSPLSYPPHRAYGNALLTGVVVDDAGNPVEGATARVRWDTFTFTPSGVEVRPVSPATTTDRDGRFTICGVPADQPLSVQATTAEARSMVVETRAGGRFAFASLVVR